MKNLIVKPGMKFYYNLEKYPYMKDCFVKVVRKHGKMFHCLTFDSVCYSSDLFYKYELEQMVLSNE